MRCDCLCCVMSRDAMRCHVMCAHVMCPAMATLCVRSGSVTMWWSKVLFCTTKYYCVLQSTTPVLLCTTKYYSSTTLYYTVLQRTTPVLLCTTKYYSSTTLYCKVLLQYYSVLQSTTPVYYSVLQVHQILRPPRKMNLMIDPRHIWNVIYNARSKKSHTTTSPNAAPATQNESHDWSPSHIKSHLQCAEQAKSTSNLTKYCACHEIFKFKISAEAPWIASANRKTIRRPSDDHPSMKSSSRTRRLGDLPRPTLETHFV